MILNDRNERTGWRAEVNNIDAHKHTRDCPVFDDREHLERLMDDHLMQGPWVAYRAVKAHWDTLFDEDGYDADGIDRLGFGRIADTATPERETEISFATPDFPVIPRTDLQRWWEPENSDDGQKQVRVSSSPRQRWKLIWLGFLLRQRSRAFLRKHPPQLH